METRKLKTQRLVFCIIFVYFAVLSWHFYNFTLHKPIYNWDILPYVATAKSFELNNLENLRRWTFNEFKMFFPNKTYKCFILANPYRKNFYKNPEVFRQQLTFYKIRVLYNFLVFVLYKLGLNIIKATYWISSVSVLLGLWIIFFSLQKSISPLFWFIFPFLSLTTGILEVARLSTPDGLAFLGISLAIFCFLKSYIRLLFLLTLPCLVLIRTDLIIFSILLCLLSFIFSEKKLLPIVALFLVLCLYLIITHYYHYYGWKTIIYHTFIKRVIYPENEHIKLSFSWYFSRINSMINAIIFLHSLDSLRFGYYLCSAFIAISCFKIYLPKSAIYQKLLILNLVSLFYVVLHFLMFPVLWSRFFVGSYLLMIASFLFIATEFIKKQE